MNIEILKVFAMLHRTVRVSGECPVVNTPLVPPGQPDCPRVTDSSSAYTIDSTELGIESGKSCGTAQHAIPTQAKKTSPGHLLKPLKESTRYSGVSILAGKVGETQPL